MIKAYRCWCVRKAQVKRQEIVGALGVARIRVFTCSGCWVLGGVCGLILVTNLGCDPGYIPCRADLGVCPRPEVGVLLDEIGIVKEVWFEDKRIGPPYDANVTLFSADVDEAPGDEVVFRGNDGILLIHTIDESPFVLAWVPIADPWKKVSFIDIEQDGNTEFIVQDSTDDGGLRIALWSHSGERLWTRAANIDGLYGDVAMGDIDADGTIDFAITTKIGVEIVSAEGVVLTTLGNEPYNSVALGDLDGDGDLEIVAGRSVGNGEYKIEAFNLDGTLHSSFVADGPVLTVDRLADDEQRDYIRIGCSLLDDTGAVVGTVDPLPEIGCSYEDVDYSQPFTVAENPSPTGAGSVERLVRFSEDDEPHRAEFTFSFESQIPFLAGLVITNPTRAIVKFFDPDGALVYEEVIASKSGPGSVLVLPTGSDGREFLLIADGTKILSYRAPTTTGG
ncbi:MAG: VCBS repeat-containing protein [Planctomycetes bacterium]|nr:VCBS repeat-containing protein [Planctomycetota bacterium]